MKRRTLAAAALIAIAALARAQDGKTVAFDAAPDGWKTIAPRGGFGPKLEFELGADGDGAPAKVTVHYFNGSGGTFEDNLKRWASQFKQADGSAFPPEKATTEKAEANGVKMTIADLEGTYTPPTFGAGSSEPKPGYRMIAAVVEGPDGPWFVRIVGPAKTVAKHHDAYLKWLKSAHAADKK